MAKMECSREEEDLEGDEVVVELSQGSFGSFVAGAGELRAHAWQQKHSCLRAS